MLAELDVSSLNLCVRVIKSDSGDVPAFVQLLYHSLRWQLVRVTSQDKVYVFVARGAY